MEYKVLVLDDIAIVLNTIKEGFKLSGIKVDCASSYEEAKQIADKKYDAMFLDHHLNNGDNRHGEDFGQEYKNANPDTRIYMITGYSDQAERLAQLPWVEEVFVKPFDHKAMERMVALVKNPPPRNLDLLMRNLSMDLNKFSLSQILCHSEH